MTRIPYVQLDELGPEQRQAVEEYPPLNVVRILAHAQSTFLPYLSFGGAVMAKIDLDPILRELAVLRTAQLMESEYEWIQHATIARTVGISAAKLAALEGGDLDHDAFSAGERAVLALTEALVRTARPADEVFAAAQAHLDEREIVELILLVGHYMMLGRLLTALDVDLDLDTGFGLRVAEARGND